LIPQVLSSAVRGNAIPILENKPGYPYCCGERILSLSEPNFWPILGPVRRDSDVQTHRLRRLSRGHPPFQGHSPAPSWARQKLAERPSGIISSHYCLTEELSVFGIRVAEPRAVSGLGLMMPEPALLRPLQREAREDLLVYVNRAFFSSSRRASNSSSSCFMAADQRGETSTLGSTAEPSIPCWASSAHNSALIFRLRF
jgi:hypothetical protein